MRKWRDDRVERWERGEMMERRDERRCMMHRSEDRVAREIGGGIWEWQKFWRG